MGLFKRSKDEPGFAKGTYVIAGLGNPGKEYEETRHNMGYKAIDVLSSSENIEVRRSKFHSLFGRGTIAGRKVILVKPETYMNRSGIAVREAAMYFDVAPENLIVIYDDIDLPAGSIRIRKSGGAGTHNGMKSVVQELGTKNFIRITIVGNIIRMYPTTIRIIYSVFMISYSFCIYSRTPVPPIHLLSGR